MASLTNRLLKALGAAEKPGFANMQHVDESSSPVHAIFSFVIDQAPRFAYDGYHLARSLIEHCADQPSDIHVQVTPEVNARVRGVFADLGCQVHQIERFGDGRYCNKLAQLPILLPLPFDRAVLLDTDMIAVNDLRPFIRPDALMAKVVDRCNPSMAALRSIAHGAGLKVMPAEVGTDSGDGNTYLGNCNGGFYSVPRRHAEAISEAWRKWATWLLDNRAALDKENKGAHVDQVSMWLAIHMEAIPFLHCASNVNYYLHEKGKHRYCDATRPICLLHYHDSCINVLGMIEPSGQSDAVAVAAVAKANAQIGRHFNNALFWDMRYERFPERGSGVGSRGENLAIKQRWLAQEKIEEADSVLDVGCGDLEVMRSFNLRNYLGLDQSDEALATARRARPEWSFRAINLARDADSISPADFVVCFEVLIHQETREAYERLIRFLADKTRRKLFVSGYEEPNRSGDPRHMIFFYEPLQQSLRNTGRFGNIERIGSHTDVAVFKCEV